MVFVVTGLVGKAMLACHTGVCKVLHKVLHNKYSIIHNSIP